MYKSVRSKSLIGSSMSHENLMFYFFVRTTSYDLCLKWLRSGVKMGVLFQSSSLISRGLYWMSFPGNLIWMSIPGNLIILDVRICLDEYSR